MRSQTVNVFVSYSHADAALVAPVVRLLRVNESLVFQDTDRIPPGKRWRDEIAKALAESTLVVVFWCDHACRSTEVSSEWKAAIEANKDLLPLLLDATPLPPELGQFQWIDFRGVVGANHSAMDSSPSTAPAPPTMARPMRAVWHTVAGVAAGIAVVLFGSISLLLDESPPMGSDLPDVASSPSHITSVALLLGILVAVGGGLLWFRRWRSKPGKRIESAESRREDIEHRIAVEVEAEILRRIPPT